MGLVDISSRLRATRFRALLALVATPGLALSRVPALRVVLPRAVLRFGALRIARGALAVARMTRRAVRPAGLTAFLARGFLFFMPNSDPVGGCQVRSDVPNIRTAVRGLQR